MCEREGGVRERVRDGGRGVGGREWQKGRV